MIILELLLYIGIIIILAYILDYFYLKSKENFIALKQAYREYKQAKKKLQDTLDK